MALEPSTLQRLDARALAAADAALRVPNRETSIVLQLQAQTVRSFLYNEAADPVSGAGMVGALERNVAAALEAFGVEPKAPAASPPKASKPSASPPTASPPSASLPVVQSTTRPKWWAQRSTNERIGIVLGACAALVAAVWVARR